MACVHAPGPVSHGHKSCIQNSCGTSWQSFSRNAHTCFAVPVLVCNNSTQFCGCQFALEDYAYVAVPKLLQQAVAMQLNDPLKARYVGVQNIRAHKESARSAAWAPSDLKFTTGSDDGSVKVLIQPSKALRFRADLF